MEHTEHLEEATWKTYLPLLIIIILITAAAITSSNSLETFLINFMAGFFLVFGGFKLIDLKGFTEGYATYDLLAMRWYGYGYFYPFIEVAFGLVMLGGFHPDWLLWTEAALMLFSGIGVAAKLAKREPVSCACLGTVLKVPLTYVTLVEDFGMAALALLLIILL